jgi:hypothetical protein
MKAPESFESTISRYYVCGGVGLGSSGVNGVKEI